MALEALIVLVVSSIHTVGMSINYFDHNHHYDNQFQFFSVHVLATAMIAQYS